MSCNLGCNNNRCEITDIAQNQVVTFTFNTEVDPLTVNSSTIQFRTATGDSPVGDFLVHGTVVEFVPQVLVVGGQTFFGFRAGETYTLTMPGGLGEPNSVRSTANTPLKALVSCTLNVTRGIVDLNGVPPSATLISPTATTNVPFDTIIVLEFNEIIDVTPFLNSTTGNGPIVYNVRRTHVVGGVRSCNPTAATAPLLGSPRVDLDPSRGVSVVTMRPTNPLPCDICVEITVTDRVHDLSGKPAAPQTFSFITQSAAAPVFQTTEETFDDDSMLDHDASSGDWVGGRGTFGTIGGDGMHGDFDPALGQSLGVIGGKSTYLFNTDNTVIPATNTLIGQSITVTDGKYRFGTMVVPRDVRVRFTGSHPPQFSVRGKIEIAGVVEVMGEDRPLVTNTSTAGPLPGQPGGAGGVFGGNGGKGGDRCPGVAPLNLPLYAGVNGQDCRVQAGHAYAAQVAGTHGTGSAMFPANGLTAQLYVASAGNIGYAVQTPAGGGGGGNALAGSNGRVVPVGKLTGQANGANTATSLQDLSKVWTANEFANRQVTIIAGLGVGQVRTVSATPTATPTNSINITAPWDTGMIPDSTSTYVLRTDLMGPVATGGIAFPLFPIPAGAASSLHFLVGGAGGGGAGSSPLTMLFAVGNWTGQWAPGCGGGGGGGAIAFRAGNLMRVTVDGRIQAQGGSGVVDNNLVASSGVPAPSGAGAGGSVLLQTGDRSEIAAGPTPVIDVRGGTGGTVTRIPTNLGFANENIQVAGGNGGPGVLRLEVPRDPQVSMLPNVQPPATAANVALLTDRDPIVGFQSKFYSAGQSFGPEFVRYEIDAVINNVHVIFSDDPTVGQPARFGSAPIQVRWQAGFIDPFTGAVDPNTLRPWHEFVGPGGGGPSLNDDSLNGFRFIIQLDTTSGQTIEIDSVRVVFRYC